MANDKDLTSEPEAFAEANQRARLEYLQSLTLDTAARDLEKLLLFRRELETNPTRPPLRSNPPPNPSLAILLAGKPSDTN